MQLMEGGHSVKANKKDEIAVQKGGQVIKFTIEWKYQKEYCGVHTSREMSPKVKLWQNQVI